MYKLKRGLENIGIFYKNFGLDGIYKAYALFSNFGKKYFFKKTDIIKFQLKAYSGKNNAGMGVLYIRKNTTDDLILKTVIMQDQYSILWNNEVVDSEPHYIIDAGANIGDFALLCALRYPDAKIIAIEPEESNFKMLKLNTKPYKNVICIQAGLWNNDAYLETVSRGTGEWGFVVRECERSDLKGISMNTL